MTWILRAQAARRPHEVALTDTTSQVGWGELADLCERGVQALDAWDLAPGQRVGVVARNSLETVLVYMIARYAGVRLVPISFHLTASELRYIVDDANVVALFHDGSTESAVQEVAQDGNLRTVHLHDRVSPQGFHTWLAPWVPRPIDLARPVVSNLLYTSGTTGFPKGVLHPQEVSGTVDDYVTAHREPDDIGPFLTVGPLYHAGPLGSVRRVMGGRPLVVLTKFEPQTVLDLIERYAVTGTTMVPTHFVQLLGLPDTVRQQYRCTSLRLVDHTGSACPVAVKRAMIEWWGPVLVERYGGTESGTICSISSQEWLGRPGSVGRPADRFRPVVLGDDDVELGAGQVGRLYFHDRQGRGIRYEGDPDKTAAAHVRPGVFTLGDVGLVDEDGYVFITGRQADLVVSGGVNLYPAEIERVLQECPGVAEAAVIGVPDDVMGERLHAFVVPATSTLNRQDLDGHLTTRLAGPKRPRTIDFVTSLPRNPMGKLLRQELRRIYDAQG